MKLEHGKTYMARDGRRVKVETRIDSQQSIYVFKADYGGHTYTKDGMYEYGCPSMDDLIDDFVEKPVTFRNMLVQTYAYLLTQHGVNSDVRIDLSDTSGVIKISAKGPDFFWAWSDTQDAFIKWFDAKVKETK